MGSWLTARKGRCPPWFLATERSCSNLHRPDLHLARTGASYSAPQARTLFDSFEVVPEWAQKSLAAHAEDKREYLYTLEEFEQGLTHDPIWNVTMGELRETGIIHSYLRMLWSKKNPRVEPQYTAGL